MRWPVRFRILNSAVDAYVDTGSPMDKAAPMVFRTMPEFVDDIEGSFSNVVGLPVERFVAEAFVGILDGGLAAR